METNLVKFFSYVVNENVEGLQAIFGRKELLFENAELQGYELCVQTSKDLSNVVSKNSPIGKSPREVISTTFGEDYELYTVRPSVKKTVPGKIWYISPDEFAYLREWEMIDYGMSEDITAKARTESGGLITVQTYGLVTQTSNITKVIEPGYMREEISTKKKLDRKRKVRLDYIARKKRAL